MVHARKLFHERKDDWRSAELTARESVGGEPSRALVNNIYRRIRARRHEEPRPRKLTLEELDHEQREEERRRVKGLRKGTVKKKLL